jgi:hypothetical protein
VTAVATTPFAQTYARVRREGFRDRDEKRRRPNEVEGSCRRRWDDDERGSDLLEGPRGAGMVRRPTD